jgi:hypothetical protein
LLQWVTFHDSDWLRPDARDAILQQLSVEQIENVRDFPKAEFYAVVLSYCSRMRFTGDIG